MNLWWHPLLLENKKIFRFYSKERSKRILKVAMPSASNSLLDIINMVIDLLMIGSFGASAVVAVSVSLNYIMMFFSVSSILFVGNSTLIARFLGAKEKKQANEVVYNLLLASIFISIPFVIFGFLGMDYYFDWMNISQDAKELGLMYLGIVIFNFPFILIRQVCISSFSASGLTTLPFYVKIFITFLNISLKYCLIFGFLFIPALGVKGAAISTLIVTIAEAAILFSCLFLYPRSPIRISGNFNFDYIKRALKIGFPTGFERLSTLFVILLMTKFIAMYGTIALAGYQIATKIEAFAFMPGFGFTVAAMALVGQNIGAKKPLEAKYSALNTILIGGTFMGIAGLIMSIFAPFFSDFFTNDSQVIQASIAYLIPIGLSQIPLAVIFILDGALRGAGVTKITLVVNVIMIWGIRVIPCAIIAHFGIPVIWIYICITLETFLRAYVYWIIFAKGKWRNHKV